MTNSINVTLTNHAYHRAVERLGFQGSIEELIESLNMSCNSGYKINQCRSIYFADCHIVVRLAEEYETGKHVAKTILRNVYSVSGDHWKVRVKWEAMA